MPALSLIYAQIIMTCSCMLFCRFTRVHVCSPNCSILCASCLGANDCVDRNKSNTSVCSSHCEANERNHDGDDSNLIIHSVLAVDAHASTLEFSSVTTRKFQLLVGDMSVMLSIQVQLGMWYDTQDHIDAQWFALVCMTGTQQVQIKL